MKNTVQNDERVIGESNRIYRLCFFILCGGIFLDLIIKFNLYTFWETTAQTLQLFLLETVLLVTVFYMHIFMLARRGIAFGSVCTELGRFPCGRYALLASVPALMISLGIWLPRFALGSWEYGVFNAILFCSAIIILTFLAGFLVLFGSFYAAFRVAKSRATAELDEE